MSIYYYIIYNAFKNDVKGFMNAKLLFVFTQLFALVFLPIIILSDLHKKNIILWEIKFSEKLIFSLICLVLIILFDYYRYFNTESQLKIIQRYTNRYSFIENYPLISWLIFLFSFLTVFLLACIYSRFLIKS